MIGRLSLLLLIPVSGWAQTLTPREIAARVRPAVVRITAIADGEPVGQGTGFIVSSDGRLVTNYHVIKGADRIKVQLSNGRAFDSVLFVSSDETRDLAILKVQATGLPMLVFGEDRGTEVGDPVYVMGNPLGLEGTFSDGLISAKRTVEGVALIQITAPISPGSSGGPVVTSDGRVVGIATLTSRQGQNLNLAVPARYARGLLAMNDDPRPFTTVASQREPSSQVTTAARDEEPMEPWAEVLLSELEKARRAAESLGYVQTHSPVFEMIDEGKYYDVEFTYGNRGATVILAGVCDADCTDLDLQVHDGRGKVIVKDMAADDSPVVEFQILQPGTFTVRVYMAACSADPCGFVVQSFSPRSK